MAGNHVEVGVEGDHLSAAPAAAACGPKASSLEVVLAPPPVDEGVVVVPHPPPLPFEGEGQDKA